MNELHLKYVDDLSLAESINMYSQIIPYWRKTSTRPIQSQDLEQAENWRVYSSEATPEDKELCW